MIEISRVNLKEIKFRLRHLLYGEYFTDAVRNTLTIILPVTILFYYDQHQAAIGTGIGALLISLTDLPGNRKDKFNSALSSIILFFIAALVTSFSLPYHLPMAVVVFVLVFAFAMLSIYGPRKGLTGMMATILSIFIMGLHPHDPLLFSLYVLSGSIWYYLISLIQIAIWPYRSLHHAIFECISTTATFLKAKAKCYDIAAPLEDCYKETIALHIKVNEKQELVRNLLLSDKSAMSPNNVRGRQLISVAKHVIDLYEQVTAVHYDYAFIRKAQSQTGALTLIIEIINLLAQELNNLSASFLTSRIRQKDLPVMDQLQYKITALVKLVQLQEAENAAILFKVIKNIEEIIAHIEGIKNDRKPVTETIEMDQQTAQYSLFLSPSLLSSAPLKAHFSIKSPIFRFSLRLSVLCLAAYLTTLFFPEEKYSYWMLLTIVIVARPRFGLTLKRNMERLSGTLTGAIMGLLLVLLVKQMAVLLVIAAVFLVGFFTFNRIKYSISVFCITGMVIICLNIYQGHVDHIISERLYYTLIGCAMTFGASYLFPVWETGQLKKLVSGAIEMNIRYLQEVSTELWGKKTDLTRIKLARKNAYLQLAKLSEALRYMLVEPHIARIDLDGIHLIETLNYRINAMIASISLSIDQFDQAGEKAIMLGNILDNLNYCLANQNGLNLATIKPGMHSGDRYLETKNTFTNQVDLLNTLSLELKSCFHA